MYCGLDEGTDYISEVHCKLDHVASCALVVERMLG